MQEIFDKIIRKSLLRLKILNIIEECFSLNNFPADFLIMQLTNAVKDLDTTYRYFQDGADISFLVLLRKNLKTLKIFFTILLGIHVVLLLILLLVLFLLLKRMTMNYVHNFISISR